VTADKVLFSHAWINDLGQEQSVGVTLSTPPSSAIVVRTRDSTEFPYVLRRTGKVVVLTLSSCRMWEDEEYELRWQHGVKCKCGWDPDEDDYHQEVSYAQVARI
jgi:hypothetical protein